MIPFYHNQTLDGTLSGRRKDANIQIHTFTYYHYILPIYSTPHTASDLQTRVHCERDFFPRRRFRPFPISEVSVVNIKGHLIFL